MSRLLEGARVLDHAAASPSVWPTGPKPPSLVHRLRSHAEMPHDRDNCLDQTPHDFGDSQFASILTACAALLQKPAGHAEACSALSW